MNRETIVKMVKASGVSSGELVLVHFWGEDSDKEIANSFLVAVASIGATPFLLQQARSVMRDVFLASNSCCFDERYFELFTNFDAVLDVFTYQPVVLGYEIEAEKFELYRKYMARLFAKLMNFKRFTQIRIPTVNNAIESGIDPQEYIRRMTQAYDINYQEVYESCHREKERFAGANRLSLYTGIDCVLRFDLTGRSWHIDAGDGDLPCGEIYIAPVEERTEGSVFFETLFVNDTKYSQVTLHIKDGKVCGSNHQKVEEFFHNQPPENQVICELGFGMNPNIIDICGYTALDEKMANTFHVAVGENEMFGGKNTASIHVDFVGHGHVDIQQGVFVMGKTWQSDVFTYFDKQIVACKQHREALFADDRTDEGTFESVRANVYDIFRSVFSSAIKLFGENNPSGVKNFFLQRSEQIPASWKESYDKANQCGNIEKMQLEIIKLEVIEDIRAAFHQLLAGES